MEESQQPSHIIKLQQAVALNAKVQRALAEKLAVVESLMATNEEKQVCCVAHIRLAALVDAVSLKLAHPRSLDGAHQQKAFAGNTIAVISNGVDKFHIQNDSSRIVPLTT